MYSKDIWVSYGMVYGKVWFDNGTIDLVLGYKLFDNSDLNILDRFVLNETKKREKLLKVANKWADDMIAQANKYEHRT